jgi:hypothetical protein
MQPWFERRKQRNATGKFGGACLYPVDKLLQPMRVAARQLGFCALR